MKLTVVVLSLGFVLVVGMGCNQHLGAYRNSFRGHVGLQMYSLRKQVAVNVDSALAFVQSQGIRDIEVAGFAGGTAAEYKARLTRYGLKASSMGAGMKDLRDSVDRVIANARVFGAKYIMLGWIDHKGERITVADMDAAADVFNRAGKRLKAAGIQFCYHIHGYEFVTYGDGTLFDYLYEHTDPEAVKFEEDIFWTKHGGNDPTAFLRKYGKRIALLHVKDMDKRVVGNLKGSEKTEMDVAWGTGQIDIKSVCLLAREMGIKHFFLEDESDSVLRQIPVSLKYAEGF